MAINADNYLLAVVAIAQAVTSYMAYRTQRDAAKTREEAIQTRKDTAIVRADTEQTRKDMRTVEQATNSMKDALVEATERAAGAEGMAKGIIQGLQQGKVEGLAEGRVEGILEERREAADDRQERQPNRPG